MSFQVTLHSNMRRLVVLFVALFSCSSPKRDKIVVPELHSGFYLEALDRINGKLKSDPDNERFIDQKIFYCGELNWPTTCIAALDAYKEQHGMTNQLVEQYIAYYTKHQRYQLLLNIIDKWDNDYQLKENSPETYIKALVQSGKTKRARRVLRSYLDKYPSSENVLSFASTQYLNLKDTLIAAYNLGKLYRIAPQNDLMWNYGTILVQIGYENEGFEILSNLMEKKKLNPESQLTYAKLLAKTNRTKEARSALVTLPKTEDLSYLLAEWYEKDQLWDSSAYVLEKTIAKDSSNREAVWRLGEMYENRGWLSYAQTYYKYLVEMDSTDTLAHQRIALIQRKIAYLQRLKFEESKIPVIQLEPKKIKNQ